MRTRFTVGEMARLSGLSKQTLIFYDRTGVFSPRAVDPSNGYRYYAAEQLEALDNVLMLKEMGLSLEEIRAFMHERSGGRALEVMEMQRARIREKMERLARIERRLARKAGTLRALEADRPDGVQIRPMPQDALATEPVDAPGGLAEQDVALKRLLRRAQEMGYPHYYQLGTMVAAQDLLAGRCLRASYAFLPLDRPVEGCAYRPEGLAAVAYHAGAYARTQETYARMLEQIGQRGLAPMDYAYEYCILDSLTSANSDDYVTQIVIPLR